MECYACPQKATERCSRCGNPYCRDHGGELCAGCLDPANATPSSAVFRASVLSLLVASVLALWLLVRPPSLPGESSGALRPERTPTPAPLSSPTAAPGSPTPAPSTPKPTATPEPTPAGPTEYTVVEDDTLSGIAETYGITVEDLMATNGLTEADVINPGDVLVIP